MENAVGNENVSCDGLISVIIPVYNTRYYLEDCVRSVFNQSYRKLEIILVNDGSTDGSATVCDRLKAEDDRVKVIHKKNGGLSDARNVGIDESMGDYVFFLDSDDYLHKDVIEKLYDSLLSTKSEVSICGYSRVTDDGGIFEQSVFNEKENFTSGVGVLVDFCTENATPYIVAWNKLYKRSLFDDVRFPVGRLYEDVFTFKLIFEKVEHVGLVHDCLYYYRYRDNGITNSEKTISNLDQVDAMYDCFVWYENKGYKDLLPEIERKVYAKLKGTWLDLRKRDKSHERVMDCVACHRKVLVTLLKLNKLSIRVLIRSILFYIRVCFRL